MIGLTAFALTSIFIGQAPFQCPEDALPIKVEQSVSTLPFDTHKDRTFGFYVKHPSAFKVETEAMNRYQSYFKATYQAADYHITQQCYATVHAPRQTKHGWVIALPMLKGECFVAQDNLTTARDCFTVTLRLPLKDEIRQDYLYHAKYIKKRHVCYVQSLTYPEKYADSLRRLTKQIDDWTVWEES